MQSPLWTYFARNKPVLREKPKTEKFRHRRVPFFAAVLVQQLTYLHWIREIDRDGLRRLDKFV
jgi:hypothetical protein